ncbi:effector-associated constant component EACC1 [Streptomyces sp. NC-S4]
MRVRIGADDGDDPGASGTAGLTGDFADWLTQDREVSRSTAVRRVRATAPSGAMSGDLVEWISLAVSSGFSATALVYAHRTFRASLPPRQRSGAQLVVEYDGVRIVVEDGTAEDAARVARALAGGQAGPGLSQGASQESPGAGS